MRKQQAEIGNKSKWFIKSFQLQSLLRNNQIKPTVTLDWKMVTSVEDKMPIGPMLHHKKYSQIHMAHAGILGHL